ncbi:MAG: hypothetical protein K0S68_63 [Candidatus Saccharibacteria bacterium]|jgi:hypothetical protein|nr:hypothetical protein [Candidatus Saccharibacteria bacterium]
MEYLILWTILWLAAATFPTLASYYYYRSLKEQY